jgi:Holliday junction resolvasome RuvABC endonuclease subunit
MILAIDPILVGTAVARGDLSGIEVRRFTSQPSGQYAAARIARYDRLVAEVMDWIGPGPYDAIFLEGYSFGSNDAHGRWITEYGGILRWHLVDRTSKLWEVSPFTLKLFAAGHGRAKKPVVSKCLRDKYGVEFDSDDEYDAFGLFRIGLVMQR